MNIINYKFCFIFCCSSNAAKVEEELCSLVERLKSNNNIFLLPKKNTQQRIAFLSSFNIKFLFFLRRCLACARRCTGLLFVFVFNGLVFIFFNKMVNKIWIVHVKIVNLSNDLDWQHSLLNELNICSKEMCN